jgi:hypothetical protein
MRVNNCKNCNKEIYPNSIRCRSCADKEHSIRMSGKSNSMYGTHRSGKSNPFYGKKHSQETRKKMSKSAKIKIFTEQHKKHMSEGKQKLKNFGSKSPNWRGGTTALTQLIRTSSKYILWRKSCFERDNYTCQMCNVKGGYLEVDHIKSFRTILLEYNVKTITDAHNTHILWDIDNGRTLCKPCHKNTDTYGNKNK